MKAWMVAAVSLVLGAALGVGATLWELGWSTNDLDLPRQGGASEIPPPDSVLAGPRHPKVVVVNGEDHDFQTMDYDATGTHAFLFRNDGTAPLKLTKGKTTCKCALSKLARQTLLPGETAEVTLQWKPIGSRTPFKQRAVIGTNDPARPSVTLSVHGYVTPKLWASPESLSLGNLSGNQSHTAHFDVFTHCQDNLKIVSCELADEETAEYFQVHSRPLSPDELEGEHLAKAGVRAELTVGPALSLGSISQTIRLVTNLQDAPPLEVPVGGKIASDITISASRDLYDRERNLLKLGTVRRGEGTTVDMYVLVKGPHRQDVRVDVGQVVPDVLHVKIGERKEMNRGKVIKYPLTVEIHRDSRPVSHLGTRQGDLGKFVINTTHPQAGEIPIFVRFAVH